ncbi:oxidoreductase-like domain-containing protein [Massilia endophytica]|uniref:oxidoreductase-like domain-containing protein n=1 Tax=Massilia endophytica TaxID=2899220 RepID=UPI001E5E1CB7|nr:oxidoreductase-like domain-containing protein [Massilia endophytica]UGQ45497.1 oxidoreductase-like domain-containing protein [Massilia endophytica]
MPDPEDPRPEPPAAPKPGDCCGSGCVHCVYDLYEEAMERYREALAAWEARHGQQRSP